MPAFSDAQNIDDLRQLARRKLPRGPFEFVDRGTEDEVALRAIRSVFDAIRFRPRVLDDVSQRDLSTSFFGQPSRLPIAVAPTGGAVCCTSTGKSQWRALRRRPALRSPSRPRRSFRWNGSPRKAAAGSGSSSTCGPTGRCPTA